MFGHRSQQLQSPSDTMGQEEGLMTSGQSIVMLAVLGHEPLRKKPVIVESAKME
jgi:hypothetical protein